ncbi:hypothetical protein chiPu_0024087, partial [Chiloscyllium punctatum]|nr:hypothetical protein [Chiloscyllium punctatum]
GSRFRDYGLGIVDQGSGFSDRDQGSGFRDGDQGSGFRDEGLGSGFRDGGLGSEFRDGDQGSRFRDGGVWDWDSGTGGSGIRIPGSGSAYMPVLVQRVVCQLQSVKGDRLPHPVGSGSWGIWVDVHTVREVGLGFPAGFPLLILPLVTEGIHWGKIDQHQVLRVCSETGDGDLAGREHPSGKEGERENHRDPQKQEYSRDGDLAGREHPSGKEGERGRERGI